MRQPRRYVGIPAPEDMQHVLAKIQDRCAVCPSCETKWLWIGNHKDEIWHATFETNFQRYSVRKTVHAATAKKPLKAGSVVVTRCECPNCLNPELLATETKGDVVRRQTADGLLHHAAHRAAINRGRSTKRETKLDMAKAREIRASEASTRDLAKRYGVSPQAVSQVRLNRTWRESSPFQGLFPRLGAR